MSRHSFSVHSGSAARAAGPFTRFTRLFAAIMAMGLLSGCLILEDHLTVNADGSGEVVIEVAMDQAATQMAMMGPQVGAMMPDYPPTEVSDAAALFVGDAFDVEAEPLAEAGRTGVRIRAAFADIDTLMHSRYAAARGLIIETGDDGALTVSAVPGLSGLQILEAAFAEDLGGMVPATTRRQVREQLEKTEATFRLTLPGDVEADEHAAVDAADATATWSLKREEAESADTFHAELEAIMTARSPGPVEFDAPSLPRPVRQQFEQLEEGTLGQPASVDADQVAEEASFHPVSLTLERSFDLAGEGRFLSNEAKLIGVVVLPAELAPRRWAEPTFDRIVDDQGNDLRPREDEHRFRTHTGMGGWMSQETAAEADGLKRHLIDIEFALPPRSSQWVTFDGAVDLRYGGPEQVIRIADAITAADITEQDPGQMFFGGGIRSDRATLEHAVLEEMGFQVELQHAAQAGRMLNIHLATEGEAGAVTAAQVYDVHGKPYPTIASPAMMDETLMMILVAGTPEPPLSLALTVEGGGPSVSLPIVLEELPLHQLLAGE